MSFFDKPLSLQHPDGVEVRLIQVPEGTDPVHVDKVLGQSLSGLLRTIAPPKSAGAPGSLWGYLDQVHRVLEATADTCRAYFVGGDLRAYGGNTAVASRTRCTWSR